MLRSNVFQKSHITNVARSFPSSQRRNFARLMVDYEKALITRRDSDVLRDQVRNQLALLSKEKRSEIKEKLHKLEQSSYDRTEVAKFFGISMLLIGTFNFLLSIGDTSLMKGVATSFGILTGLIFATAKYLDTIHHRASSLKNNLLKSINHQMHDTSYERVDMLNLGIYKRAVIQSEEDVVRLKIRVSKFLSTTTYLVELDSLVGPIRFRQTNSIGIKVSGNSLFVGEEVDRFLDLMKLAYSSSFDYGLLKIKIRFQVSELVKLIDNNSNFGTWMASISDD